MTLADLRKLSIRRDLRIRFTLSGGMECLIGEHGIAQVPGLRSIPEFNLEEELAAAQQFTVESPAGRSRKSTAVRTVIRQELEALAAGARTAAAPGEHDDE
ncbi:MAG: hypothetical protein ABSH45_06940 [Bryobacteraceae bacterium]